MHMIRDFGNLYEVLTFYIVPLQLSVHQEMYKFVMNNPKQYYFSFDIIICRFQHLIRLQALDFLQSNSSDFGHIPRLRGDLWMRCH